MRSARHRRLASPPPRRDPQRLGALLVLTAVAGLGAVAGPVSGAEQPAVRPAVADLTSAVALSETQAQARSDAGRQVSRGQDRRAVVAADGDAATADVVGPLSVPASTPAFAQEDTEVVAEPAKGATALADVGRGAQVALSGRTQDGFAEVVQDGALAWIDADLVGPQPPPKEVEPVPVPSPASATVAGPVPATVSGEPCSSGGGIESGLTSNTVGVYRAVCAAFPGLVFGGIRPGDPGEHGTGQALDIMLDTATGNEVAAYLQQNASALSVDNVIWRQRIWLAGDPVSQWKSMEDRGSATQNHMDHVHVGTR